MGNRTYHTRGVPVHGYAVLEHPLYVTWADMHARCSNPNSASYKNYGGRGIKVCRRWNHFENFALDMGLKPNEDFTIERVDNSKGYAPGNCIWTTRSLQCMNRRVFKNNTTGSTGVTRKNDRYIARMQFEHVRYVIGRFDTVEQAARARQKFEKLFFSDREKAVAMVEQETVWCTSSTKVRGVTRLGDGGYIVRVGKNGIRHYLGYFKSIEEASRARRDFIEG